MSIDQRSVRSLVRAIAYDLRGSRLGRVAQVFLDDRTDEPAWVAVDVSRTRGMRLLPLAGAGLKGRHLVIRAERATVRSAPRIDLGDGQLSSQDESRLLEHYGLLPTGGDAASGADEPRPVSPWADDTERETAWEQPAQQQHESHETREIRPDPQRASDERGVAPPAVPAPAAAVQQSAADSGQHPAESVQQPTGPVQRPPADPGQNPAEPVQQPTGPVQQPTGPVQQRDTAPTAPGPPPNPPPGPAMAVRPADGSVAPLPPPDGGSAASSPAR